MRRLLELQADRIELVLASHNIPSRITGGIVTPRFVQFRLLTPLGVKLSRLKGLAEEIALALNVPSCRVFRRNGNIHVQIPRSEEGRNGAPLPLQPLLRESAPIPPHTAALGLDEEGRPLFLRLPSPEVTHVLISGTTGSGKTELARTMIASLVLLNRPGQLQLVLIDPKGRGFAPFAGLPHLLCPIISEMDQIQATLSFLIGEMERRDAEAIREPRIFVFVDELADLLHQGGRETQRALTRLLQRGREAGIHVVACTQKPSAALLGPLLRANFPVRLVGKVANMEDARVAAGIGGTHAERLLGRGDFLLVTGGEVIRFQAAFISSTQIREIVAGLRNGRVIRASLPPSSMSVIRQKASDRATEVTTRRWKTE